MTRLLASCSLATLLCGCRGDIVPVSGVVKVNGKPLAGAVVTFQPLGNRQPGKPQPAATGSVGRTDALGHYSLRLVQPDRTGAVIGDHTVTISPPTASRDDVDPPVGPRLPPTWYDGSQRFRVPLGGTSEANFEIVQDAPQSPAPAQNKPGQNKPSQKKPGPKRPGQKK